MAFVTRCPYCGAVWLLPDKDTAERGPVRCSSCNHSFDATRALLCVDESVLPNLPKSTLPKATKIDSALVKSVKSEMDPAEVESFVPPFLHKRSAENCSDQDKSVSKTVAPSVAQLQPIPSQTVQVEPSLAKEVVQTETAIASKTPLNAPTTDKTHVDSDNGLIHVNRTHEPRLSSVSGALQNSLPNKAEPSIHITDIAQKKEPKLTGVAPISVESKVATKSESLERIIPAANFDTGIRVVMASEEQEALSRNKPSRNYAGVISVLLAITLLSTLAFVSSIVFNQRIIENFPQSQEIFTKLCGKIPCPGFFLAQPEAFVVSKTTLRPLDESGNYTLDVTLVNGSNFSQAVPWLELELLDDNNGSLMKRTITPQDYLSDPRTTKSISPNRSLTIRVSLQTNVTSARCVVKPTYPLHK